MAQALFGGAVLGSFLAGMVALFAPCCVSVMLPAYLASSMGTRRALVAMTFVFAAGVGLVILPIALGAAAVSSLITGQHFLVYLVMGMLMLMLGVYVFFGGTLAMPMPGMRARPRPGMASVLSLGAFSGIASSCCAPVLAGVVALAGASGSLGAAVVLGTVYVFGMVAPLFVISLLWDRFNWGESKLLRGARFRVSIIGRSRSLHSTAAVSGLILVAMGALVIAIAFNGQSMSLTGWALVFAGELQHWAHVVGQWLSPVPSWLIDLLLLAALVGLAIVALRQLRSWRTGRGSTSPPVPPDAVSLESAPVVHAGTRENA